MSKLFTVTLMNIHVVVKKRVVSIPFGNCLLLLNFAHAIVMYTVPVQYMTVTCHVVPFILYM